MKSNNFLSWIGTIFGSICTAIQTDHVFQIISLVITILSTLVSLGFTIWSWWKKASADGKIDKEEVDELIDDVNDVLNDKKKGDKE